MSEEKRNYSLQAEVSGQSIPIPILPYQPPRPKRFQPVIGLIGCGGITADHLNAYRHEGYQVAAICDIRKENAEKRREEFYPQARVYTDYRDLLNHPDINVVDIALHPEPRAPVLRAALEAGKHVLSQKPFVLDLDLGEELAELADHLGLKLAVNQNGRWAPYLSYIREAIRAGLIGEPAMVEVSLRWNHTWTRGTPFEKVHHLILFDFAIHWFDAVSSFFGEEKPLQVFAKTTPFPQQQMQPPLMAQVQIEFERGLAALNFNGHCLFDPRESITVVGTRGVIRSQGAVCQNEYLHLETASGWCEPVLQGKWFYDGFRGTMNELLCAIEEDREFGNSARQNLKSLALCFAAVKSANTGVPCVPGQVRHLEF